MNETFFPTSAPAEAAVASYGELLDFWGSGKADINRLNGIVSRQANEINDLRLKIQAVNGYIADCYSENGELSDEIKEIAGYLGITLTKRISGTATFEISWSAQVPLDFENDDFDIAFDVDCESYEAEDFEWMEENTEVNAEDGY